MNLWSAAPLMKLAALRDSVSREDHSLIDAFTLETKARSKKHRNANTALR
jgi:hypothetical protein